MRTSKHIGLLTIKGGEMLEVDYEDYQKVVQSYTKSELGKVYISSLKRMLDKTIIVDFQEKWIEDRNAVIIEDRPEHLLAVRQKLPADSTSPGYIKFLVASIKMKRKFGDKYAGRLTDEQKVLVNAELKKQGIDFQV